MGVKELPEWQVERQKLHDQAKQHLHQTSCTIWNENTRTYEHPKVRKTSVRGIGEVTQSIGIQLYFQLLKRMGLVFCLMFIVSAPTLTLSCMGRMLDAPSALSKAVAMTSVANMGQCPDTGCRSQEQERNRCLFKGECSAGAWTPEKFRDLRVKDVTPWLGMLDGIAVLIFMGWAAWFLQRTIPRDAKAHDRSILTPADYTCEILGLPRRLDDSEHKDYTELLKAHLLKVLSEAAQDAVPLEENAIEEVSLVRDYHGAIGTYALKGEALVSLANDEKLLDLARKQQEAAKEDGKPKEKANIAKLVEKREKEVEKRTNELAAFDARLKKQSGVQDEDRDVVKAFVTLKKIQYKEKLEFEYRYNQYMLFRCCEPERLRFRQAKLQVTQAPEPTDLFWENLDFPHWSRVWRRAIVMLFTIVLLLVCIFTLVSISASTEVVAGNHYPMWVLEGQGCFKLCSWSLYGTSDCSVASQLNDRAERFFDTTDTVSLDGLYLQSDTSSCTPIWESPACNASSSESDVSSNWIAIDFPTQQDVKCMSFIQDKAAATSEATLYGCNHLPPGVNASELGWSPEERCIRMQALTPKTEAAPEQPGAFSDFLHVVKDASCSMKKEQFLSYDAASLANEIGDDASVNCFCLQQVTQNPGLVTPPYETKEQLLCKQWSYEQAKVYGMMGLGIISVVMVNLGLKLVFSSLIRFKRLESLTENTSSQLSLLFLSQFINTGILIFLVNCKLAGLPPGISSIVVDLFQIGNGSYYEPNAAWFIAVGVSLCITVFTQVLSTTLTPVVMSKVVAPLLMWWSRKSEQRVTLDTLKQVYVFPDWDLGQRAAESLNVIACIVMYSGGMPVLYLAGVLYCFLAFQFDKYSLLTGSKKPPAYDAEIMAKTMRWIPLFAFLHVLFACFVLSNPDIFPSDFSVLRPLAEGLFGVSLEEYQETMLAWETSSTEQQDANYNSFLRARFLDFSRKSVWLLMLLFLVGCAYYVIYYLYVCLLKPVLAPFLFVFRQACPCCFRGDEEEQDDLFADAKEKMERQGMPTGYSMAHSSKYEKTAKAIEHQATMACIEPAAMPEADMTV